MTTCPSELTCSLHADGALDDAAAAGFVQHLADCTACGARVAALNAESRMLRAALEVPEAVPVPAFEPPLGSSGLAWLGAGATLLAWLAAAAWRDLLGYVPAQVGWLNPFNVGGLWDLFVTTVLFVAYEGTPMLDTFVTTVSVAAVVALAAAVTFAALKTRHGATLLWSALLLAIVLPSLGHALEIRHDGALGNVAPGETIDDTLVIFGDSATIDGTVTGDVIAFTRTLTVRGQVMGDLVGFSQSIDLEGSIGGTVYVFAASIDTRSQIARNLFGFAGDVTLRDGSDVQGNATLFANSAVVRGRVAEDVTAFASDVEISGDVGGDAQVHAERVRVLAPGRIGGELRTSSGNADDVQVASGATIVGTTVQVDEELEERSEYLDPSFYFRQVLRVAAAFVAGLVLLWLFPTLKSVTLDSAGSALAAGAVGLVAVILVPIVSVIACITIIGIPIGIVGFIAWLLALYFAKIVIAILVGRRLFAAPSGAVPHDAALLITGLVLVVIAVNLPYIGWLLNAALVSLGTGLLVQHFAGVYRRRYV